MKKNNIAKLIVSTIAGLIFYAMMGELKENPEKTAEQHRGYREMAVGKTRWDPYVESRDRRNEVTGVLKTFVTYADAVEAISDSDMFSTDKRIAIETLMTDQDDGYYRGIIGIAESDMFSSDKVLAIQKLTKYKKDKTD